MCQHNPNVKESTILLNTDKKHMAVPNFIHGVCSDCEESFKFIHLYGKYVEDNGGDFE